MPDQVSTIPPAERASAPGTEPDGKRRARNGAPQAAKHRHRALVWSLVVLASIVLLFSMLANWVQTEVLGTDQWSNQTQKILQNQDVQQQLSLFAVDQLYANVDVQAQLQQRLPPPAQPFSGPISAATRQLATNVSERALASPQVQALVSSAAGRAQQAFIKLVEDKGQFVSSSGGVVTFEYGSVVADLASRVGVDPATIANIQALIQQYSTELKQRLTAAQTQIASTRSTLTQLQQGKLSPQTLQDLVTLQTKVAALQVSVAGVEQKIKTIQPQAPAQLQGKLSELAGVLGKLDKRLTRLQKQTAAVIKDPSQANVIKLDPSLAALQTRINTALNRQALQHPGELVLMNSSQLSGLQDILGALRSLGFVLPVLALLLYMTAIYLAKEWRRETLMAAGGGILGAALLILLTRNLIGGAVVDSVAKSDTVKPAITAIWNVLSAGLHQRALFVLLVGVGFIVGGMLAGPGRHEVAVRRFLAPHLREQPVAVYAVLAFVFLVWLSFLPTINNFGQVLVILALAALAVVGVEILRRQTAQEFPAHAEGSSANGT
jgi:hypothetical protein